MFQYLYRLMVELTNGKWTSLALQSFAKSKWSRFVIPHFANVYQINQAEMADPLDQFGSLHDFFIRTLKKGTRPIDSDAQSIVSPVDCVLEDLGMITKEKVIKVKGKDYSVLQMLGSEQVLEKYIDGKFMVLYLSPSHYHRIHSPVNGMVKQQWRLGQKSFPVNRMGLKYGKQTLSNNYRMITEIETDAGALALVKVGAMFVNSIETIHQGEQLTKGSEMAYFTFGSTVVLLFEKNKYEIIVDQGQLPLPLKVGERIARFSETC